jgi:hypothetical protein
MEAKQYLGDGVYLTQEGLGVTLTTENGIEITNRIVLEPEVLTALFNVLSVEPRRKRQTDN